MDAAGQVLLYSHFDPLGGCLVWGQKWLHCSMVQSFRNRLAAQC